MAARKLSPRRTTRMSGDRGDLTQVRRCGQIPITRAGRGARRCGGGGRGGGDAANGYLAHNQGEPIAPRGWNTCSDPRLIDRRPVGGVAGGLGLGVFIVDQIVRSHAGAIAVESARERGTTFDVRSPRRPP